MKIYTTFRQPNDTHKWQGDIDIEKPPKADDPVRIRESWGPRHVSFYLSHVEALRIGSLVGMRQPHANRVGEQPVYTDRHVVGHEIGQSGEILPIYEANYKARRSLLTPEVLRAQAAKLEAMALLIETQENPQWGSEA